jgi:membrane protein implicated in regulation of membrane protease activity
VEFSALSAVSSLLLAAHLLAASLASIGPLIGVWLEWPAARGERVARRLARELAWHSLAALVVTALLGVVQGWLAWNDNYQAAVVKLGAKVFYGILEILFSAVLMLLIALSWRRQSRRDAEHERLEGEPASLSGRWLRVTLAVLAGSNLVYHFPILMVVMARLVTGEDTAAAVLTAADFRQRIIEPAVFARCLHFWLASIAVSGVWLLVIAWQRGGDEGSRIARWGARIAVIPALSQIPSGIWLLSELSPLRQSRLLGGDGLATAAFAASVLLALWLLNQLAAIGMGETDRPKLARAAGTLIAVVALMAAVVRYANASP